MGIKKVIATILVATMTLGSAMTVTAATTSPITGETTEENASVHQANKVVTTDVTSADAATLTKVAVKKGAGTSGLTVNNAVAKDGKTLVAITTIGNGKTGVFAAGIKKVYVKSPAKNVTIKANAFKGSKVKTLSLKSKKTTINKNAFKGTKQKTVTIKVNGKLTAKKGSLTQLSKKSKIVVSKKAYSKAAFKKLKKSLKKAGFKGKITRK